jgi:hypothetical protein
MPDRAGVQTCRTEDSGLRALQAGTHLAPARAPERPMGPVRNTRLLCRLAAIVVLSTLAITGTATADECASGCILGRRACVKAAQVTMLGCRLECSTSMPAAALGACLETCRDGFRAAKERCQPGHTDCLAACTPEPPTPPTGPVLPSLCRVACGRTLTSCARTVLARAQLCIRSCRGRPDRLACLTTCAAAAREGEAACAESLPLCVARCGGSPSGAFLDEPVS